MKKIKAAFKPAPERFHYSVQSSINEAILTEKKKHRLPRPVKAIIAAAIIIAMIPTSVFAANQIYNLIVQKKGDYAVEVKTDTSENSPQYVKMKIEPIDGFEVMNNTEGLKYCHFGDQGNLGFSFYLVRPKNGIGELYKNAESYEKIEVNGHEAIIINNTGLMDGKRFGIYFEKTNIILSCFVDSSVSEAQMKQMMNNVEVVAGTEEDHTNYLAPDNDNDNEYSYEIFEDYTPICKDETFNTSDENITAKISNIKILDTTAGLSSDDFYFWGQDVNEFINSDGTLKPRKSEIFKDGDGINTVDKIVKTEEKEQLFILADITYTNSTDTAQEIGVNLEFRNLEEKNEKLQRLDKLDRNDDDGLAQYIENANQGNNYYIYTLSPRESRTFTVGFRCDKDMLNNAYLVHNRESSSGTSYKYYVVKVK